MPASAAAGPCAASRTTRCSPAAAPSPTTSRCRGRRTSCSCARRTRTPASRRSTRRPRAALPGVVAIVTGDDLGRPASGRCRCRATFKRPDGGRTAAPPQHVLAVGTRALRRRGGGRRGGRDARQARDAAEAVDVRLRPAAGGDRRRRRGGAGRAAGLARRAGQRRRRGAPRRRRGDRRGVRAGARTRCALDLVNQRLAPAPIEPRAVLADFDAATGRITLRTSRQTPTGAARRAREDVLGLAPEQVRVRGRRRRRRLRHEDRRSTRRTWSSPTARAHARAAGASGAPSGWRSSSPPSHGRDRQRHGRAGARRRRQGAGAAHRARCANVGAYATPAGVAIQLLIGPWVTTSIYDIPAIDLHHHRGADQHRRPPAPTAAPAGPRRST